MLGSYEIVDKVHEGQIYQHFKGEFYQVIGLGEHTETGEKMVIYKRLFREGEIKTYIRPYVMFTSKVDEKKYPEHKNKQRFTLVLDPRDEKLTMKELKRVFSSN